MRPLRHTYIQKPMNMPSGIVMAIVNVPHTLSASALTNDDAEAGQRDDDDEEDRDRARRSRRTG